MNRCRWCGRFIPKGHQKYCTLEHALAAARDAQRQIHDRQGPIYDRWKEGMARGVTRIMTGIEAAERKHRAGG